MLDHSCLCKTRPNVDHASSQKQKRLASRHFTTAHHLSHKKILTFPQACPLGQPSFRFVLSSKASKVPLQRYNL
jgi:hypothetical protein